MKIRMNWRMAGMASGAAAVVVGVALALAAPALATPPGPTGHKQTICHRTDSNTNPYVVETVDVASILKTNGHDSHTGPVWNPNLKAAGIKWGDIIPAFTYTSPGGQTEHYAGKNMDGTGGFDGTTTGKVILANNCKIPTVSTTTSTSTTTPTTTSTSTSTSTSGTSTSTSTSGTSTSTSTSTSGTLTSSSINVSGTSSASTPPQSTSSVMTTPTSSQVSSTTPGSQSSHGSAHNSTHASKSTSPSIQVLGTSSRLATTSGTASPAAVITSGAPSATAHTGQSMGILPYLILLGGLGMLLASALLRRGHHRV